jgi:hypothetical protein
MLHVDIPTLEEFKALAQIKGDTCVSLYLPTSPLAGNIRANRIAFRDLAREALAQLSEAGADRRKIAVFEGRFDHLAGLEHDVQDEEDKIRKLQRAKPDSFDTFWRHLAHGLAVLSTPGLMRMFRLPDAPKPLAEVADRLHLTPLIRAMTSPQHIFVLALAEESVRLITPSSISRPCGCRFQTCLGTPSKRHGVRPFTYGLRAAGCKTWKARRCCCINM